MKKKSAIIVAIILMSIGFASVSTTLIINGAAKVSENNEDFSVIFTAASIDGKDVYSTAVDETKKTITFETSELKTLNQTSILTYEVTNNSSQYDAEVNVKCVPKTGTTAKYTSIKNKLDNDATKVLAKESLNGTLTINLDKTSTEEVSEEYVCKLEFNAVERTEIAVGTTDLYNLIKNNADTKTIIDYKVRSGVSGTNGIYMTTQTNGNVPVYYYRGDADKVNNNIIFNNMCWKIIRTTEDNGIKIIYNGVPTDGKCETQTGTSTQIGTSAFNTNYNDNAYVGYMYGTAGSTTYAATHANTNESTIKRYIDSWYSQNFDETATSKLEDTVFCNDRSTKAYDANTIGETLFSSYGDLGYGKNKTFYGAAHRASYYSNNPNPSLVCQNQNDKFTIESKNGNGKLKYPVGLISSDEFVFAGFNTKYSNLSNYQDITNYLYTNNDFWAISSVLVDFSNDFYTGIGMVTSDGHVSDSHANSDYGVRPVVSLASGTLINSNGDGTSANPYIVL